MLDMGFMLVAVMGGVRAGATQFPCRRVGDFAAVSVRLGQLNCPIDKGSRHFLRLRPLKKGPGAE